MGDHNLYTLWVRGGNPFSLLSQANPSLDHDGGDSVSHLILSLPELGEVKKFIQTQGASVTVSTWAQTDAQEKERLKLLGVGQEGRTWPSFLCPECAWFDPLEETPCGKKSWDRSVVESFKSPKAVADWEKCDAKDRK